MLRGHLPSILVDECREGLRPHWEAFHRDNPQANRGPHRYFLAMPFEAPWFSPRFFIDPEILRIVRSAMDDRVVADQWGCDVPLFGSGKTRRPTTAQVHGTVAGPSPFSKWRPRSAR